MAGLQGKVALVTGGGAGIGHACALALGRRGARVVADCAAGPAKVKSPGPPGSIEKGPEEERGHRVTATAPAATAARFEVRLTVLDKR